LGQCGSGDRHTSAAKYRFLSVQRQVVGKFVDQHLGQQNSTPPDINNIDIFLNLTSVPAA
jgi:hypothetical protein